MSNRKWNWKYNKIEHSRMFLNVLFEGPNNFVTSDRVCFTIPAPTLFFILHYFLFHNSCTRIISYFTIPSPALFLISHILHPHYFLFHKSGTETGILFLGFGFGFAETAYLTETSAKYSLFAFLSHELWF